MKKNQELLCLVLCRLADSIEPIRNICNLYSVNGGQLSFGAGYSTLLQNNAPFRITIPTPCIWYTLLIF